jgi:Type II site-specific deoxyribonuclease
MRLRTSAYDDMTKRNRIHALCRKLEKLTNGQLILIEKVIQQFTKDFVFRKNKNSDIINDCILQDFGDALRIHHCFSREAFTKDKFEYALERVSKLCEVEAHLAPRGNPGHDITINSTPFSLKTQADKDIKKDYIHISKFMELGKGQWGDQQSDLIGLRDQFFHHMRNYERILTLRRLFSKGGRWHYELVEIPKPLLLEARNGTLEMAHRSSQLPKPGYCHVLDPHGGYKFQLYFDGGTERKLQIKKLKKSLCTVQAEWIFEVAEVDKLEE